MPPTCPPQKSRPWCVRVRVCVLICVCLRVCVCRGVWAYDAKV